MHLQFDEVVVEYFRNGRGHVKQLQLSTIVGQHTELLHEELSFRETRLVEIVNKVFSESSQCLKDGG